MGWKDYEQNIKVRLITSFFNRAVTSAAMPFMALFFAQEKDKVWAGLFLILTVFIGFLVSLIGGYISDRFSRKRILLLTSTLSTLMFLFMTLSLYPKDKIIWLFAIAYIGFIISSSLGRPAMQAIIIDSTTPENRKAIYTVDYWLMNLAMALGAALGGLLYMNHQKELFVSLTLISAIIPIAYKLKLVDEFTNFLETKHENIFLDLLQNYKIAIQDLAFVKVVIGSTLIFAAEFSLNSYIGIRLSETFETVMLGGFEIAGVRMLSILNIENMLLVVFLTFLFKNFTDRLSGKNALLLGLSLYGIGYIIVTSANTWYVLLIFNFIATVGELIYSPIRNAEQANMIPDNKRGSYSAFAGLSYTGAELVARVSIIIGAFLNPTIMSVYIGVIIFIGALLLYTGLFVRDKIQPQKTLNKIS
ncbi:MULTISPECIES: MDR family MFS transporter [Bacillus]|uniref:MFS transporter n=4 Tax=Bacillus cereus group TaxID=86661 RepID=A0A243CUX9_BACTU|nr:MULTISPECIES: MFS transporter [Bacillus cereus group]EEM55796.1 Permease [Bacillus thuringiensis serovar monterrey BGSC 4AJ1]EEM86043.1 Permease [Bacillus thuringiensis serovar pulsiensis BGSC 4CC1]MEB9673532.1 MFS transporter [Bacillus anthracis]OTW46520.1 MFS transporter [Bacillus thuringiensis serovar mexicanensis]OTX06265.1 MFS transporter [Bacillus thuringiensis serovar monterrey]